MTALVPNFAPRIILASTSPYRRELLVRLGFPFDVARPDVDEAPLAGELPLETARRLGEAKAAAIADHLEAGLVIGSDQVAHRDGNIYQKPGNRANAISQLLALSGQTICFDTAVCLMNAASSHRQLRVVRTDVTFRDLSEAEIERYVDIETPYDCAGAAKSEGLGISLIKCIKGDDPTALVGLPLIALCDMLRAEGMVVP